MYNITTLRGIPSAGALLGTSSTSDVISRINDNLNKGHEFFGSVNDIFKGTRQVLMDNIINPIRESARSLKQAAMKITKQDTIRPLIKDEDFEWVPPSMHLPILMFEPVKKLLNQGRIDGFGYDPDYLPEEDVYGRLIDNGTCESWSEDDYKVVDGQREYTLEWTFDSDDPDLDFDELDSIRDTRGAIQRMMEETDFDPTNYPCSRN